MNNIETTIIVVIVAIVIMAIVFEVLFNLYFRKKKETKEEPYNSRGRITTLQESYNNIKRDIEMRTDSENVVGIYVRKENELDLIQVKNYHFHGPSYTVNDHWLHVKLNNGVFKYAGDLVYRDEINNNSEEKMENEWTIEKLKKTLKKGDLIRDKSNEEIYLFDRVFNNAIEITNSGRFVFVINGTSLENYEFIDYETLDVILPPKDKVVELFEHIGPDGDIRALTKDMESPIMNFYGFNFDGKKFKEFSFLENGRKFLFYPETKRMVEVK